MAQGSNFVRWDTKGTTAVIPARFPRVKEIRIDTPTGAGALTVVILKIDGQTFFSWTPAAGSILDFNYTPPQLMPGLTWDAGSTQGIGQTMTVVYE